MTFEEFAAARLGAVVRFAAVLAGERALAEDIVQEVLIRAHARWDQPGRPSVTACSRRWGAPSSLSPTGWRPVVRPGPGDLAGYERRRRRPAGRRSRLGPVP